MLRHLIIPSLAAVTLVCAPTWAQTPTKSADEQATNDSMIQTLSHKIRDELTAKGFSDLKILPTSFVVAAKDQTGKPVVLVIKPNSAAVIRPMPGVPDGNSDVAPNSDTPQNPNDNGIFKE
jgi:hypothetical protein